MPKTRRHTRIPWGRIVRTAVKGIRAALVAVSMAIEENSDGGAKITREELGQVVDAGLDKIREELVEAAFADLNGQD